MLSRVRNGPILPTPDRASLAHSERVAAHVRRAIDGAGGSISFAEFMHLVLYAPGLGYYSAGNTKFGAGGDFITAPEASPLFARVLARQCASLLQGFPEPRILELGAGSGALAAELLRCLPHHDVELARYSILEVSPDLRQRQQAFLREMVPERVPTVEWLDELPDAVTGVVIANEVVDALPVERFQRTDDEILQYRVRADGDQFSWLRDRAPGFLERAVLHVEGTLGARLPHGYVSEISAGAPAWIADIAARVRRGFIFLFDYGVTRREYYSSERNGGWLRCHFRHHAHSNPLIYPGIQDLSSWVDFTAIAEAAAGAGMEVSGFVTQAQFLLHGGLEAELAAFAQQGAVAQLELAREAKMLTLPGEMGEHFKCLGLSKDQGAIPTPFAVSDRAHTL